MSLFRPELRAHKRPEKCPKIDSIEMPPPPPLLRSHIMEELLWVTRRGGGKDRWLRRGRGAAGEAAAPFRCSERGDDTLFAALSVGVTPEVSGL